MTIFEHFPQKVCTGVLEVWNGFLEVCAEVLRSGMLVEGILVIDHTGNVLCAVKALAIKSKWSVWKKRASNMGASKLGGGLEKVALRKTRE